MSVAWPKKTRDIENHHYDSTVWDDFQFRDDDIVIATYAKTGTTWLQQIVGQLIFNGAEDVNIAEISPWLDMRVPPKAAKLSALEAQTHRRFLKTHLPVDALVFSPKAKYLYLGRDGRDVLWSLYNHHSNYNDFAYSLVNETPGRIGLPLDRPPETPRKYFTDWMTRDGHPNIPFWQHIRSWWEIRALPNVLLLHYNDLQSNLQASIERIAQFLGFSTAALRWPAILEHCSFTYMRTHAAKIVPLGGALWHGGASTFLHKGTNGRWREVLSQEETCWYDQTAEQALGLDCARWLASGSIQQNGPMVESFK